MTPVNKIRVEFTTSAQQPDEDVNGESFLFIGGREFRINQGGPAGHKDKQRGKEDKVTLGDVPPGDETAAEDPIFHDPRKPYGTPEPLMIEDLEKYPMWLRYDPVDGKDWHLDRALVQVFAKGDNRPRKEYEILSGGPNKKLVLGRKFGLYVSLGPSKPPTSPPPTGPPT